MGFLDSMAERVAINSVVKILLIHIKSLQVSEFYDFISRDGKILDILSSDKTRWLLPWVVEHKEVVLRTVTEDFILNRLRKESPAHWNVLNTPTSREWLRENLSLLTETVKSGRDLL